MKTKLREITQNVRKHGDPKRWVYRVRHVGNLLSISVRITSRFLIYPNPISPPLRVTVLQPDETLLLSPGEWCEIKFQGHWCKLVDADNRRKQ